MSGQELERLSVRAADADEVAARVVADAERAADDAQREDLEARLAACDEEVRVLRANARGKVNGPDSLAVRKKVAAVLQRRDRLVDAAEARDRIADALPLPGRKDDESDREFMIRTGKLTPFQGQYGYERRQSSAAVIPTRRRPVPTPAAVAIPPSSESVRAPRPSENERINVDSPGSVEDHDPDAEYNPGIDNSDGSDADDLDYDAEPELKRQRIDELDENSEDGDDGLEGDAVSMVEEEELEFDGGLRAPSSVYDRLFEYQKTGFQWLWELHCQSVGGILADEMGLGKTIQIIAFLAALNYSEMLPGSILVVAPATVLQQWKREFRHWYPRFRVRVLHHSVEGAQKALASRRRRKHVKYNPTAIICEVVDKPHGVLVTSYEQVRKHQELLLDQFEYCILDEGHKLRNPDADITQVCKQFTTPHRLILSGSPLQNKLSELWSLFDFVYPGKLGTLPVFYEQFTVPITMGGYATASRAQVHTAYKCALVLKDLVSPYLLRRLKKDVKLDLPAKREQILFVKLTPEQREAYTSFLCSRSVRLVMSGKLNLLFAVTALRKICNHPDIPIDTSVGFGPSNKRGAHATPAARRAAAAAIELPDYGNWNRSGKMQVLDKILATWKEQGSRVLLFTQTRTMLDILETFVRERGYEYRRMDGETPVASRMTLIDSFNRDPDIFVFILTTKVGGLGVNLCGGDRVVIFDPDWNPATDMQAQHRSWRVGQKKPVTIYRLICSGTIEEKMYHRQIFKQFLSNKVLSDPRQRRFFKPKDIKELFRLGDDEEAGTETGDLFAGTRARETTGIRGVLVDQDPDTVRPAAGNESRDSTKGDGAEGGVNEGGNAKLLNALFDDTALHSSINHDDILNSGTSGVDTSLLDFEADKVASKALEEVKRSASRRRRQNVAVPTWTGKSGLAGLTRPSSSSGASGSRAASLLERMKQRNGLSLMNVPAPSSESTGASGSGLSVHGQLLEELLDYMRSVGGESSSAAVVERFRQKVGDSPEQLASFKSLLRRIAVLHKRTSPEGVSVWKLYKAYMRPSVE